MISCPGCGAGLRFDIRSQLMKCDHCDGEYDPFLFKDKDSDAQRIPSDEQKMDMAAYRCPQCGAELYTADMTDVTAVCSYCGGANILFDRMCRIRRPDYVIPFKLTKEDCIARYMKETRKSFFTPRYMRTKTVADSFRAIYMPYWSFDITQKGRVKLGGLSAKRQEGDYSCEDYFVYEGDIDNTYTGLAHDASRAFDDGISECLEPFDIMDRVPFSPAFLSGFYADAADVKPDKMERDALSFARESTLLAILADKNEDRADRSNLSRGVPREGDIPATVTERAEAFYPVWFMSVRRGDRIFYAAVNGQTGKVAADLPISPIKLTLFALLLAAGFFVLLNLFAVLKPGWALGVTLLLMLFGLIMKGKVFRKLKEKLDAGGTAAARKAASGEKTRGDSVINKWLNRLGILEIIIGIAIIRINPVVNRVFYLYSFLVVATFLVMIVFILKMHAKLATRRPPQFNKRGNDYNA